MIPEGVRERFLRGVRDPIDAAAQMLERALPDSAVDAINSANNWLADQGLPLERLGDEGLQGSLEDLDRRYREEHGGGLHGARMLGNVVPGLMTGGAGLVPTAASTAGRVGLSVAGGAAGGALSEPVTGAAAEDGFWGEKAKQAAVGAVLGGAGGAVAEGVGKLGRQATRDEVLELQRRGVEPTIGQASGGMLNHIEEKLASAPIVGDVISGTRGKAVEQFNIAAINEAVDGLGVKVSKAGAEGISEAQDAVSDAYERAAQYATGVNLDNQAIGELANLADMVAQGADEQTARNFERFIDGVIMKKVSPNGGMDRETFQYIDQQLSKKVRGSQGEQREAFEELRRVFLDTAARQNPDYAEAYKAARTASAKLMRVEEAAMAAAAKPGDPGTFTPGQLVRGSRKMETGRKARRIAAGEGLMQDLGTAGQTVLGDVVPNSGTADRAAQMAFGGGSIAGLAIDPFVTMAALGLGGAGAGLYTTPMQRAMVAAMQSGRGAGAGAVPGLVGGSLAPEMEYLTGGGF